MTFDTPTNGAMRMMFDWDSGSDHMDGAWGWLGAGMMIIWMILLAVAAVALIAWLIRSNRPGSGDQPSRRESIDMQYATGEIDEHRREQMLQKLAVDS